MGRQAPKREVKTRQGLTSSMSEWVWVGDPPPPPLTPLQAVPLHEPSFSRSEVATATQCVTITTTVALEKTTVLTTTVAAAIVTTSATTTRQAKQTSSSDMKQCLKLQHEEHKTTWSKHV